MTNRSRDLYAFTYQKKRVICMKSFYEQFYNMASEIVIERNGEKCWKVTTIKNKKSGSPYVRNITLSQFLKMTKEESW